MSITFKSWPRRKGGQQVVDTSVAVVAEDEETGCVFLCQSERSQLSCRKEAEVQLRELVRWKLTMAKIRAGR